MILGVFHRRRIARLARADRIRQSADLFLAAWGRDLDLAFWRAHDRAHDPKMSAGDRRMWLAVLDEIDSRRPRPRPRADTATRMLFRDRGL